MQATRSLPLALATAIAAIAGPWAISAHATVGPHKLTAVAAIKAKWLAPGSSVPYARSRFGVVLASVECFPTYILRLPPGLTTLDQREAYVAAHQADMQAIPCAYPTKLSELRPAAAAVDHERGRFQAATAAYDTALGRRDDETVAVGNAQVAFDNTDASALAAAGSRLGVAGWAGVHPDAARDSHAPTIRRVRACCSTGSFYQNNYDTLLNSQKQVQEVSGTSGDAERAENRLLKRVLSPWRPTIQGHGYTRNGVSGTRQLHYHILYCEGRYVLQIVIDDAD